MTLRESAFPDVAAIRSQQLEALHAMVEALRGANRFYTSRLPDTRFTSLEDFQLRMPFTRKQEIVEDQCANPPFGTNLTYPIERYTRFNQTSGTTGAPIRWLDTMESWSWMVDNWVQVLTESGVEPGERIFFAFSFGPFLGFWTAFEAGVRLGCLCLPGGGMSSAARLRSILDNSATVLCCTPTYAIRLGEVAHEDGIDLAESQVRTIIVAGEPGAGIPATREQIERMWPGATVRDHHGMTEIGPVSFECPVRRGVLHVMESGFIPEVIDESGEHVQPGESGELVLTNLGRIGSPLIRYRTGDLVQTAAASPCACGRYDLALEGGILGRTDDMVVIRGVNLHPSAVEDVIRRIDGVGEYRVEILRPGALPEIRIQVESDSISIACEVEASLRSAFNLRIPVSAVPPGSLPRFELKAKRWVILESDADRG